MLRDSGNVHISLQSELGVSDHLILDLYSLTITSFRHHRSSATLQGSVLAMNFIIFVAYLQKKMTAIFSKGDT
jgi:hypothetical protein